MSVTYDYQWMKPLKKTRLDAVLGILANVGIMLFGLMAFLAFAVVTWWDRTSFKRVFETIIGFGIIAVIAIILSVLFFKEFVSYRWNRFLDEHWAGKNPLDLILILGGCSGLIVFCVLGLKLAFAR